MAKLDIQQKQQANSSQNESIKLVSEILKRTNQLIQKGDFDRAQGELLRANLTAKEHYKTPQASSPINNKFFARQMPPEPLPLAPLDAMMSVVSPSIKSENTPPLTDEQTLVTLTGESKVPDPSSDRSIEFKCYREALAKAWYDGALTNEEERHLQELRTVLEILDTEHAILEKEIKYSCYKNALAKNFGAGVAASSDSKILTDLQNKYVISLEEHLRIIGPPAQKKQQKQRDKILIIDDDDDFLNMLSNSMTEEGFDVVAVPTSDEAYTLLQKLTPDLILCDINLKTSTMNGFILYEKVQTNRNLQNIPFVFLTGLMDEKLAWTGKELGADDYLLKPVSRNALLSTLHGKLKRFKQLRGLYSQTPAFC